MRTPIGRQYSPRGKVYVFDTKLGRMVLKEDRLNRTSSDGERSETVKTTTTGALAVTADDIVESIRKLVDHLEATTQGTDLTAERKLYRVLLSALAAYDET